MGSFQKSEQKHAAKMAREINMDTMRQNFWAESIKKETQLRRSWYSQHQSKSELTKDMTNVTEIMKRRASKLRSFVPKPVDRKVEGSEENETEDKLPELKKSKETRLYNGITKEGLGRANYLKKRREKSPDDKYTFQLCSSWDYGWEMPKGTFNAPKNGRTRIVRDTFYKRYGIFYDPIDV